MTKKKHELKQTPTIVQSVSRMKKIIVVEKSKIFDRKELEKIAEDMTRIGSNIMVFGLPNSGKSTLIKAILGKNTKFDTLDEEEVMDSANVAELVKDSEKKWAVSHQYPTMDENVSDAYLQKFLAANIGLNPKKWAIIRIKTKNY